MLIQNLLTLVWIFTEITHDQDLKLHQNFYFFLVFIHCNSWSYIFGKMYNTYYNIKNLKRQNSSRYVQTKAKWICHLTSANSNSCRSNPVGGYHKTSNFVFGLLAAGMKLHVESKIGMGDQEREMAEGFYQPSTCNKFHPLIRNY